MLLGAVVLAVVVAVPMTWQQVFLVGLLVVPAIGACWPLVVPERRAVPVGVGASGVTLAGVGALLFGWLRHGSEAARLVRLRAAQQPSGVVFSCAAPAAAGHAVATRAPLTALLRTTPYDVDVSWLPSIGVRFHLGVDGISLPLLVLTALLVAALPASTRVAPARAGPAAGSCWRWCCCSRSACSARSSPLDLIVFFVFFEVVLVPMYFLIGIWGGSERKQYAATKFILYTLLGSALDAARLPRHRRWRTTRSTSLDLARRRAQPPRAGPRFLCAARRLRHQERRCGRCTPGCPTPTPRRRRSARCCSPASCSRSAPTA